MENSVLSDLALRLYVWIHLEQMRFDLMTFQGKVEAPFLPRFSHDRRVSAVTGATCLTLKHVEVMAFVVAVFEAVSTE
jgi:hypothetical protein